MRVHFDECGRRCDWTLRPLRAAARELESAGRGKLGGGAERKEARTRARRGPKGWIAS